MLPLQADGLPAGVRLPRQVFRGPMTGPSITCNPGPVHGFKLLLFPQALHGLTGLAIDDLVDRYAPLDALFDADWCAMAHEVQRAAGDDERVRVIERFLLPRWRAVQAGGGPAGGPVMAWAGALRQQAAGVEAGCSARTVERGIRRRAGQPLRRLKRLARAEQSWSLRDDPAMTAPPAPTAGWVDFAQGAGYADQAHLCREVRSITGLSPAELWRRAQHDEAFWVYRIWTGGAGTGATSSASDSPSASSSGDFGNAATPMAEHTKR